MSTNLTLRKKALKSKIKNAAKNSPKKCYKISSMSELVKTLSDKKFISDDITSFLDRNFSGLKLDLIKNKIQNVYAKHQGSRYSDAVKQFALTIIIRQKCTPLFVLFYNFLILLRYKIGVNQ